MTTTADSLSSAEQPAQMQAAQILAEARRTLTPIANLPEPLRPQSMDAACRLQYLVARHFGPVGGYKIGAPSPEATPVFGPMPLQAGAEQFPEANSKEPLPVASPLSRVRGVEAEIAFVLGRDLPVRTTPYTREEVIAAIASAHPGIELLESAFLDLSEVDRLTQIADMQTHGGYVLGPALPNWQSVDFTRERVRVVVDGEERFTGIASNTAGTDLIRLVIYLANEGAAFTQGLRAGQVVTTGSWSGKTLASKGSIAEIAFTHFGGLKIRF